MSWRRVLPTALVAATLASGQYYFSQNKIQTRDYDFRTLTTEHFRIYFYSGGEHLAEFASQVCEQAYPGYVRDFGFPLERKTPIILCNSPGQFGETNVLLEIINEFTGGFSELFKNRVVVPFDGSYLELRHVLRHELTHIFEFEMFYRDRLSALLSLVPSYSVPLWVLEGLAEFNSVAWDFEGQVFMTDLLVSNRLVAIPRLTDDQGYLVYKEGQAIFAYIAQRYGRKKVFEFVNALRVKKSLDGAFRAAFGQSMADFDTQWQLFLKVRFWPRMPKVENRTRLVDPLTNHRKDGSVYNTAVALSPSGTKIAFVSDRSDYADVYVISALNGRVLAHLIKGERSSGFESVHLVRGGLSWAPDEKQLALIARRNGRDELVLVAYPSGRTRGRFPLDLDAAYSPAFAPDGRRVALVGIKNGYADLYLFDLGTRQLARLTYDIYDDRDPAFSPSGDTLVFVSDRPADGPWQVGAYRVCLLGPDRSIAAVTPPARTYAHPVFDADGAHLYFVASDSSLNLQRYALDEQRVVQHTDFVGGVYYPSLARDGSRLALAYFSDVGWDVGVIEDPAHRLPEGAGAVQEPDTGLVFEPEGLAQDTVAPYRVSFSPDYVVGSALYAPGAGAAGYVDLAFSDALGDHRIYATANILQDLLSSDLYVDYWYYPKRTDLGAMGFQYFDYKFGPTDTVIERANRGLGVQAAYPFSRFARVEGQLYGAARENWQLYVPPTYPDDPARLLRHYYDHLFIVSGAYVFDNTFWGPTAPVRGVRARAEAYGSFLSPEQFVSVDFDVRPYLRLSRSWTLATRAVGFASFGRDAEWYYFEDLLGDPLRGYSYYQFAGSRIGMVSTELRVPFIEKLKLGFPLPIEIDDLRGVLFLDAGTAFTDTFRLWNPDPTSADGVKLGFGAGLRVFLYYFTLKIDVGWPIPTRSWPHNGQLYISLGREF